MWKPFLLLPLALCSMSCATYRDDLSRAQRHYEANEHERALALLRLLDQDLDSLGEADRARYAYLRGMNDFRLGDGYRADARYWLAIASAMESSKPGTLSAEWKSRMDDALAKLNADVHGVASPGPSASDSVPAADVTNP